MVDGMKQAMVGTFFESWLNSFGGFRLIGRASEGNNQAGNQSDHCESAVPDKTNDCGRNCALSSCISEEGVFPSREKHISQDELQKQIRSVVVDPSLTSIQKNTTIQRLRDLVWKRNNRKRKVEEINCGSNEYKRQACMVKGDGCSTNIQRTHAPSNYFKQSVNRKAKLVWSINSPYCLPVTSDNQPVPLFSATELAPTYHDGATGAILGCPHYARSCKLRHPSSGRLYTCRLCCDQERENPTKEQDSPLDRYAVTEVCCMRCSTLQPASNSCKNSSCSSEGKAFAKYFCKICNLYDDTPGKSIYHCPFCNVCRTGKGLGIDFRHCAKCNACVSLSEEHICIPQRLQGNCAICHESMFESTEPLRGLKCGHVMHLSCFGKYRGQAYTCPLCKKSVEDMKEYFAQMDAAVRMQPMPESYSKLVSKVYCQDCGKTGKVPYHFVGCKCSSCGSYNTREIERSED